MPKIQTTKVYADIQEAINSGYTTVSLQGSSRSSKTFNSLIWLIMYSLIHPCTRLSIVRATRPAIKGSVFIDFKEILMRMLIYDEKSLNKSEFTYQFANGSWVEFFSTDSEQKLRGRKRNVLFVNEANELSYLEWQQLKMRTTRFTILDYNPSFSDEHWICDVNKEKRTKHIITTYKDNPFLEQTIIDEIESLRFKNKSLWQVYGLGQQAVIEGLIFSNIDVCDIIPENADKRFIGMDFGFTNDPTAIIEAAFVGYDVYVDEAAYSTGMLTSDIVKILKRERFNRIKVISESADPRLVEEIYRAGVNIHSVRKYAGSVEAGINKMLEYRFHITKRSVNVLKEFKNYTYSQDKEGKWLNEPIDAYNHAIDAIRYIFMEQIMGGERRPIDKRQTARAVY